MEENNTTAADVFAGKGLGTAGMILGIIAIIAAFIPCFIWGAIIMGIVGLVLSIVGLSHAKRSNAPKGMAVAGIICSIIAIIIVVAWVVIFAKGVGIMKEEMEKSGALDSLSKAMKQLKQMADTLKKRE